MTHHRHNVRRITSRTINGQRIVCASIVEEGGTYQAVIHTLDGGHYVSGSNSRDLAAERAVLRGMLDPVVV